jgi:SET domain-containing protein
VPQAEVRPSPIAGHGLFATAPIGAGELVLEQSGIGSLNHCCDPNLGWADDRTLVAMRGIDAGDELTIDYACVVDDPGFVMMCHCETYRCRQVIEGTDWQIPQLQRRYAGFWAPHIRRRIEDSGAATS